MVAPMISMCKDLGSIPSTAKEKYVKRKPNLRTHSSPVALLEEIGGLYPIINLRTLPIPWNDHLWYATCLIFMFTFRFS
jgi:hypothetical protein